MAKEKRRILRFENGKIAEFEKIDNVPKKAKNYSNNIVRGLAIASELGFVISFPIVGGIFLGSWLDKKLSVYPKLTLLFLFLGVMISFANLIFLIKEISKNS